MEETLKTRNKWLEKNRIVRTKAKPKRTKQVNMPDFVGTVPLFSLEDTRSAKDRAEKIAIWFFQKLNPHKKDWYFQPKTARKGFKKAIKYGSDQCFPLSFQVISSHFQGTGQTIGLTFKEVSPWFRIDLDNHGRQNTAKIIEEFCLLYQFLLDVENELRKRGIKWFIEFRPDLTGIHFDFWCDRPKSISAGRRFFNELLNEVGIEAEVFPANSCCKLFCCVQYHQILDKIYHLPNLEVLFDFLTDTNCYEHAPLNWIADTLNFDFYESSNVPACEKNKNLDQGKNHNLEVDRIFFKGRTWQNLVDFFDGRRIFDLNTICCVVSRIAVFQGRSTEEIFFSLMENLAKIPESGRKSSYFLLSDGGKKRRIKKLVEKAVRMKYIDNKELSERKLRAVANRFIATERDVLKPLVGTGSRECTLPTIYIVGAKLELTSLPNDYVKQIDNEISSILPKTQKENAIKIAFSLVELCYEKSIEQNPIAKSYFFEFFQRQFNWKPRKGSELYKILDCLIDLGLIKRLQLKGTMFWGLGNRVSEYLGIDPSEKNFSKPVRIVPEALSEIVGYID